MSLLNDASIVVVPSGYKAGKVYSVKPTDGSGDLSFTRALQTATRVGPDGLIEKVRTNRQTFSEDFTNAVYGKTEVTVTANTTAAPNGTLTADTLTENTNNAVHRIQTSGVSVVAGIPFTLSIFAKNNGRRFMYLNANTAFGARAVFDLQLGVIPQINAGTAQIELLPNDWYRCSVSGTAATTVTTVWFAQLNSSGVATDTPYLGDGTSGVFLWGAQLETGDIATPYIGPTTNATVSVGMLANVPRLDYLGGGCPKLLLEPQRTNLAFFSENFDNAYWSKSGGTTVTANTTISPDGLLNADTIAFAGSGDSLNKVITTGLSVVSGTTYTISIFTKTQTQVIFFGGATGGTGTNVFNGSVNFGNGYFRQSTTRTWSASGSVNVQLFLSTLTAGTSIIAYGCQAELGSYATSYIPTLGAAVTRSADAASKTGISALIGQQEGVIFVEAVVNGASTAGANIFNTAKNTTASISIQRLLAGGVRAAVFVSGSPVFTINGGTMPLGQVTKIAFAYKTGSSALFVNGVLVASSALAFVLPSTLDDIFLNDPTTFFAFQENVSFNQALLFKTRLSNAQLAELTA